VTQVELAVRNGTVVTEHARFRADVGISDGRVVRLDDSVRGVTEIDARGKLVLPGGVDVHVHLTPSELGDSPTERVDDFESGTRAAAIGGVTTVGNMSYPRPDELLSDALERIGADASASSLVDFVLHPVLIAPTAEQLADVELLAQQGAVSLKIFMVTDEFDSRMAEFMQAMEAAARHSLVTMIHCEDHGLVRYASRRLIQESRGSAESYALARPEVSEVVAVRRAIAMAELTGAPLYVVHLASEAALDAIRAARRRIRVFAETRPIYLFFSSGAFGLPAGALYVGNPPLRAPRDVEAMWDGLRLGDIDTYCSDHAPWLKADKLDPGRDVSSARPGVSDLGTLLPLLFSEGVRRGRLSLERFVAVTATNAARIFGLHPRKGAIEIGSDADVVVWDPEASRTLAAGDDVVGRSDFTLYEGWQVTGWPDVTISRGEVIYADGALTATPGRGAWIRRSQPAGAVASTTAGG
jgi:dihydropyrimidinase